MGYNIRINVDGVVVNLDETYPWGEVRKKKTWSLNTNNTKPKYGGDHRHWDDEYDQCEETLWRTKSGRYFISRRSRIIADEDHFVTTREAARWLLLHEHELPSDLKNYEAALGEVKPDNIKKKKYYFLDEWDGRLTFERNGIVYDTAKSVGFWERSKHTRDYKEALFKSPRGQYYRYWIETDYKRYGVEILELIEAARWLLLNNHELPSDLMQYKSRITE